MSFAVPFLIVLALQQQAQQATVEKVFQNPKLGLSLSHAPDWVFKQRKNSSEFTIPIENGKSQFRVQIFEADYRGEADRWQQIEATTAQSLKKTVVKQWQEEFLGVPMLLTNTSFTSKEGFELSEMSGLLYTKTPVKFQFRLEAPSGVYDEAQKIWRDALLTLRTTDGSTLEAEKASEVVPDVDPPKKNKKKDPTKPEEKPRDQVNKPAPVVRLEAGTFDRGRVVIGKEAKPIRVSGHDGVLHYATGWKATPMGDGFDFTNPKVSYAIHVDTSGVLDAPIPDRALLQMANKTLAYFGKVYVRRDSVQSWTLAKHKLLTVQRDGEGQHGDPLSVFHAVGWDGDYYWSATCLGKTNLFNSGQPLVLEFLDTLAIEVKS